MPKSTQLLEFGVAAARATIGSPLHTEIPEGGIRCRVGQFKGWLVALGADLPRATAVHSRFQTRNALLQFVDFLWHGVQALPQRDLLKQRIQFGEQ